MEKRTEDGRIKSSVNKVQQEVPGWWLHGVMPRGRVGCQDLPQSFRSFRRKVEWFQQ